MYGLLQSEHINLNPKPSTWTASACSCQASTSTGGAFDLRCLRVRASFRPRKVPPTDDPPTHGHGHRHRHLLRTRKVSSTDDYMLYLVYIFYAHGECPTHPHPHPHQSTHPSTHPPAHPPTHHTSRAGRAVAANAASCKSAETAATAATAAYWRARQ